jgi:Domain of unknown function (DUF1899)
VRSLGRKMAGRFVRSSKYRTSAISCWSHVPADNFQGHVFGRPTRKEQCYDNLRISKNAWDTNLVKVQLLTGRGESDIDRGCRPIPNTSRSIGRQAEGAHSLSYQSMREGGYQSAYHCSEVTRPLCWTRTGRLSSMPSTSRC